ncbi:DUF4407 domain-containing protein [Nonomuraea terrae]|uniref:DUF4407 domain-containing protein n=1 Tax=Nonomuraea terrae TaxID=2530383 RepID=A0A4R4YYW4_9ACTN|nr:DUF4407 domain-containing protein [Nonomuraea terrae]
MIGKWLIILSGARQDVLEKYDGERARFVGLGGAVLTTACLAALAMTFALSSALKVFLPLAIAIGLVWGVVILGLDRWLATSLPVKGRRRFWLALPRVLLALLLGAVISTPLVLQIFKPEIDATILDIKQERLDVFTRAQQTGETGKRVDALEKTVTELEAVIASRGETALDPASDRRIQELEKSRKEAVKQRDTFYDEWQCQLYVGPPKCAKKGQGPLSRAAEQAYQRAATRVNDIDRQIQQRRDQLASTQATGRARRLETAEDELPKVRAELERLTGQQTDLRDQFVQENHDSDGLLLRLEALSRVSQENATLNMARLLLFLFILVMECLPVLVKLMQRPGSYDTIEEKLDAKRLRDALDDIRDGPGQTRRFTSFHEAPDHDDPGSYPTESYGTHSSEDDALRTLRDTRSGGGHYEHAGQLNDDW